jgi:hypothetical protein
VFCLAVCAVVEAPDTDGHNLHKGIPPDLWEVERRLHTLPQQLDRVPLLQCNPCDEMEVSVRKKPGRVREGGVHERCQGKRNNWEVEVEGEG